MPQKRVGLNQVIAKSFLAKTQGFGGLFSGGRRLGAHVRNGTCMLKEDMKPEGRDLEARGDCESTDLFCPLLLSKTL